jgi:drug/metabolite transporter (DMT)-like permease
LRYDGLLLLVVIIWGINFPIVKDALDAMHPFVLNVFRFIVATLILGAILLLKKRKAGEPTWQALRAHTTVIVALGLLGSFVYQVFFILGIDGTTAGNSALIMASSPVWTALIGVIFAFERLRLGAWLGLLFSLIGTFLIVMAGGQTISLQADYFTGNILTLCAAVCWGAYTAFSRPITRNVDPLRLTFLGLLCALPLLIGIALPYFEQIDWPNVTFSTWAAIVYSGGLSTGIAVVIWIFAVKRVGATHTAIFGNLVPFIALLSGFLLLHEAITFTQLWGGGLIVGGLLFMRRDRKING